VELNLAGKRAIVTGGSRGIGLAIARALAAEGATVVLAARNKAPLEEAVSRLAQGGHRVAGIPTDTEDDLSVHELVDQTIREFGGVEILVNCAAQPGGVSGPSSLQALVDDDLRAEIETKVLGYLRTSRAVAPHMIANGWGRIINVSGLAARQTGSTFGSIRNVAVAALTKNLADELGSSGINVTAVHPGMTFTERTEDMIAALAHTSGGGAQKAESELTANISIGRLVTAAEVANVVVFLSSPLSVAINGDAIPVGGGTKGSIHY
jgi:NAD(P)-dependent dehydrogenase (short-subunit alcohol dehydrogenase family)